LIKNGACTATTADHANINIYAKSAFYEEPRTTDAVCTHFSKWNMDGTIVSQCKGYGTEDLCTNIDTSRNIVPRYYSYKTAYNCEGGNEIY
jgi:transposase InsO family protein